MDSKSFRRHLRRNMTPAEVVLWQLLRNRQLAGYKFRRQHSIDNYIVDFVCLEKKLIVELDGAVHNDIIQANYDVDRDSILSELGYKTLRIKNNALFHQDVVLEFIKTELEKR